MGERRASGNFGFGSFLAETARGACWSAQRIGLLRRLIR
jgi:hypothetical protein